MNVRRVLLTSKTTLFEMPGLERRDPRLARLIQDGDPLVARVESSHLETVYTREVVERTLAARGIQVHQARRLGPIANGRYDLIVSIGGDGTVLDVARWVDHTPVLAVNSSPSTSFGHFTCCTADTLDDVLERLQDDVLEPTLLSRIRLVIDGAVHPQPVLNDVLVADTVPSATSRYVLQVGDQEEDQKSSGVWMSTAAGSTGAMQSAGGEPMEVRDTRLQYRVREPCVQPGRQWHLLGGIVGGPVRMTSRMINGGAFLDGRRVAVPLTFGAHVEVHPDGPPLRIVLMGGRTRAHHAL